MHSKRWFWAYTLSVCCLYFMLIQSEHVVSGRIATELLFELQRRPVLFAMFSVLDLVFDYVSLAIPLGNLGSIRTFVSIRNPSSLTVFEVYLLHGLPYLVAFVMTKLCVLVVCQPACIWLWIVSSLLVWVGLLLIKLHFGGPAWHVLLILFALRELLHVFGI